MAIYSLELRDIYNDKSYNLFDFDYPFYDDDLKSIFQEKFFQHYMFDEIGFPTIGYFKQRLKSKLNMIMPYYIKLYHTEIEANKCNFMLNKDLKETFIRDITNNATGLNTSVGTGTNTTTSSEAHSDENSGFTSDTPQGTISDIELYMSNANKNNSIGTSTNDGNSSFTDNNTLNSTNNSTGKETTELVSQGNIGITSSGQLLEDWRRVLINIDEQILNELNSLFMQVY